MHLNDSSTATFAGANSTKIDQVHPVVPAPATNGVIDPKPMHENEWYNQDFDGFRVTEQPLYTKRQLRIVCVGAGATGLQIAYKAERLLQNVDLQIYEVDNSSFP